MAVKALAIGIYKAKVRKVSLELLGKDEWPVIRVGFIPLEKLVGPVFVPADLASPNAEKIYFLSEKTIEKGMNSGRSSIEVLREELKTVYDYEGELDPEEMQVGMVGKEVQINVKAGKGEYTEVAFVNKVGDTARGPRETKQISGDVLSRLKSAFKGTAAPKAPAQSASSFFDQLGNK